MNFTFKTLLKIIGFLIGITGIAMFPCLIAAHYYNEPGAIFSFGVTMSVSVLIGFMIFKLISPSKKHLKARDGYLIVIVCWLICSFFGAFPYYLSGQVPSFIDSIFESVAGYTTTGATIISEFNLSHSLLLWKAITHWLGGMGILIFIISILPTLGNGGHRIASAETPGPGLSNMAPKIQDLAKLLYFVYISLTIVEFLLLFIGSEMSAFDALITSLGSISTAGLFIHPDGVGYYDSLYIEMIISIFTILASLNFILYIHLIKRNFTNIQKNVEIKAFLGIIFISTIIITISLKLSGTYDSILESLRYAFFQTTAFATTSGFAITDYSQWPSIALAFFFTLLFIGGCAASTSGSIKIIRIIIMLKLIVRGFFRRLHPKSVRAIKVGENVISAPMVASISTFILLYFITFIFGSLILSLQGLSIESTLSTAAALMSTTGLGFGDLIGSGNFSEYCPALRLFMSLLMILGRLELFTVFLLFFPSFWNPNRAKLK